MTLIQIKILKEISVCELEKILKIREKKQDCVIKQMYAEALELRNIEKKLIARKFYELKNFTYSDIQEVLSTLTIENLREIKIGEILN